MSVEDYHLFVNEMITLRTENDGLRNSLDTEKINNDKLIAAIKRIEESQEEERKAAIERVKALEKEIRRMKRSQYIPGIIGGARLDSDNDIEPTIGLGWKINLF